jgi:bifunctional DNase/RNase
MCSALSLLPIWSSVETNHKNQNTESDIYSLLLKHHLINSNYYIFSRVKQYILKSKLRRVAIHSCYLTIYTAKLHTSNDSDFRVSVEF